MVNKRKTKKPDKCNKCQAAIWTLQVEAVTRKLSVLPLDVLGELQAKLAGLKTYKIRKQANEIIADLRAIWNIQAGRKPGDIIVTDHVCGRDHAHEHPDYFPKPKYQFNEEPQF